MENYILLLLTSAIDAYIWLLVSKIFLRQKYHFKVCFGGWLLFAILLFLKSIAAKNADDEAACIINQCNDIYPVFFAIVSL